MRKVAAAVNGFGFGDRVEQITALDAGNVNDTFLVHLAGGDERIILQRINGQVFQQPALIMENLRIISKHVAYRLHRDRTMTDCRWEMVRIYRARDGRDYVIDDQGGFWRGISYVADATGHDKVLGPEHAREAGRALGLFHRLLADLKPETLHDTLPGFHNTPGYLLHYDAIAAASDLQKSSAGCFCAEYIESKRHRATMLEDATISGKLQRRIMHGDPKISNILIDNDTGRAVAIIDLDTVKPGLIHFDIGDCLRSCCNRLGEETGDHARVAFDLELGRSILSGYLAEAGPFLTDHDIAYIYDAAYLLAFELGLRFFTDYLAGNVYFKIDHEEHNLSRALVQFGLAASIEKQEGAFKGMIAELAMTHRCGNVGEN
jgi:hypothetical protein